MIEIRKRRFSAGTAVRVRGIAMKAYRQAIETT
jgi:hypothetical protein